MERGGFGEGAEVAVTGDERITRVETGVGDKGIRGAGFAAFAETLARSAPMRCQWLAELRI